MKRFHHPLFLLGIATLIWGIEPIWVKAVLLKDMPATAVIFYKFCIGSFFLLPLSWRRRNQLSSLGKKNWLTLITIATIGSAISSYFLTEALSLADIGTVLLFEKLQPLFVVILGIVFLKFRPSLKLWLALLAAAMMSYLIVTDGRFGINPFVSWWLPALLIIMPLGFAVVTILAKGILCRLSPILLTQMRMSIALVIFFFLFILPSGLEQLHIPSAIHLFWLIMSGFWSYFLAFTLYYKGLQGSSSVKATAVELGSPIFGIIGSYFWIGEVFSPLQLVATGLLLMAVFAVTRYENSQL